MTQFAVIAFALFQITIGSGAPCQGYQNAKKRTYGFRPTQLAEAERNEKSREMDEFWRYTRQLGPTGISCLTDTLKAEKDDIFFLFDGASLLYSLDKSPASTAVVLDAVQRSNLSEVDPTGYIRLALDLSSHGADVGPLAVKYLTYPKVTAYVPQHAMKLDRVEGGVMLFGTMPEAKSDQALAPLLCSKEPEVRDTAALLLGFNLTEESLKSLNSPGVIQTLTPNTRKQLESFVRHTPPEKMPPPKWSREEVLRFLRRVPHSEKEFKALEPEFERHIRQQGEAHVMKGKPDSKEFATQIQRDMEESEPFFGIAGSKRFEESAIQNLTADDLTELREDRRKSLTGVSDEALDEYFAYTKIILGLVNRLDLYKESRSH